MENEGSSGATKNAQFAFASTEWSDANTVTAGNADVVRATRDEVRRCSGAELEGDSERAVRGSRDGNDCDTAAARAGRDVSEV